MTPRIRNLHNLRQSSTNLERLSYEIPIVWDGTPQEFQPNAFVLEMTAYNILQFGTFKMIPLWCSNFFIKKGNILTVVSFKCN